MTEENNVGLFNTAGKIGNIVKYNIIHTPLKLIAFDFGAKSLLLRRMAKDEKAALGRSEIEIQLIADADKQNDDNNLDDKAEKKTKQIGTKNNQMIVIFRVDVHDFQLEISNDIRNGYTGNHGGNHGLILFAADFIAAVNRMHGNTHGCIGKQGCSQGTVYMYEEEVRNRKACKKSKTQ